jgi:N6-adenosine-specific RNA methylase IME4
VSEWPFGALRPLSYGVLLADPPWSYEMYGAGGYGKSPEAHYETMSDAEIAALPVSHLASGDCLLWMWAIWPKLPAALDVMRAWGFRYKTGGSWTKTTRHGKRAFGTGYILRSTTEPFLIGTIGNPAVASRRVRNLIESPRRLHSQKPPEARAMLRELRPHAFAAELFGIEPWPGADTWNPKPHRPPTEPAPSTGGGVPDSRESSSREFWDLT